MMNISGLTARYGRHEVLKDISFSLRPGAFTAMLGKNGSGKSTLLSCIGQQVRYEGTILLGGKDAAALSPRERAKQVALLPQFLPPAPVSVWELACFGRNPYLDFTGRLSTQDKQAVQKALHLAGVEAFAVKKVSELSGGERQRAYLAMVLAQDTPVILLDEPTTYLDMEYEASFLQTLQELTQKQGKTILAILHNLALAAAYAGDVVVLDQGSVRFSGPMKTCLAGSVFQEIFHVEKYVAPGVDGRERIFFSASPSS